jgi:8-amino-7-oxononanoate synthase
VASFLGVPEALVFTSGYAANVGLLPALAGPDDLVVSDALIHASLIDGARLSRARVVVVPHLDLDAVRCALRASAGRRAFVLTESYFSMDGDSPDLRGLRRICDDHGAALVVDEAHALGVLGPEGRGLCAAAGVQPDVLVGTFGKAFGAGGAFVAGCEALCAWLWNRARSFVFSTGLSPAVAAGALQGLESASAQPQRRERLLEIAQTLRAGLGALGLDLRGYGHVIPWVVGDSREALWASEAIQRAGYDVRAIRPPSVPRGTARLRLTASARHTTEDAGGLIEAVRLHRETARAAR